MYFPEFDGLHMEFLVVEHDHIGKSYLVQWLGSEPRWEDEKSLRRLLRSNNEHMVIPANELDANDPLLLEYSRYETSGGRARTAAKDAVKAIKVNVDKLEQASDAEYDEQDDAPPSKRARRIRTATVSIGISVNTGGVDADLQSFLECPITHEIMNDPVIAADGHTYERRAIERWLSQKNYSPMTGLMINPPQRYCLAPNLWARSMMAKLNSTSA